MKKESLLSHSLHFSPFHPILHIHARISISDNNKSIILILYAMRQWIECEIRGRGAEAKVMFSEKFMLRICSHFLVGRRYHVVHISHMYLCSTFFLLCSTWKHERETRTFFDSFRFQFSHSTMSHTLSQHFIVVVVDVAGGDTNFLKFQKSHSSWLSSCLSCDTWNRFSKNPIPILAV